MVPSSHECGEGRVEGEELRGMIRRTIEELERLAKMLFFKGYRNAASFIRRNARMMVTFAEMAMEGMRIPYSSNVIERLMVEVSKRSKNRWMRWSEKGLRSMLTLVLVRYTEPVCYEVHGNAFT
jgi:transposase-like protein